jgi:rod shape-determining protein MreC
VIIKTLFLHTPSLLSSFVILVLFSLGLITVDHRTDWLDPVRSWLTTATAPLQWGATVPARLVGEAEQALLSREELHQTIDRLKARNLVLERKVQKLGAMTARYLSLMQLMNATETFEERVLVARLVGVDPNPYSHRLIINKGARDGVYLGQTLIDASGLMGQVTAVSRMSSWVILITDLNHSIPVQVNRNGVRAIASGTGQLDRLVLRHVPDTADILKGDVLVSSGLGQRFPEGYPVGVVTGVSHDPGRPFADVYVRPAAQLNRSRHVLLLFKDQEIHDTSLAGTGAPLKGAPVETDLMIPAEDLPE